MTPLDVTRKIDSVGRIVIPKRLRTKFRLQDGDEYQFYLHEEDGRKFLCIECPVHPEIEAAKKMLEESGYKVIEDE